MKDWLAEHYVSLMSMSTVIITGLFGVIIAYIRSMKNSVNGTLAALVAKLEAIAHDSGIQEGRNQVERENKNVDSGSG